MSRQIEPFVNVQLVNQPPWEPGMCMGYEEYQLENKNPRAIEVYRCPNKEDITWNCPRCGVKSIICMNCSMCFYCKAQILCYQAFKIPEPPEAYYLNKPQ